MFKVFFFFFLHVSLHVQCQVVGSGEGPLAQVALKWSVTSVFSVVASKFIRSGEFPSTAFPVTMVRFLTCMSAHVSFQMRALGVRLPTARVLAVVGCCPLSCPGSASSFGFAVFWGADGRKEFQVRRRRRSQHHTTHALVMDLHGLSKDVELSVKLRRGLVVAIMVCI